MIVDLHSDLLSFLTHKPGRSPEDPASRCSYPQLMQGHVKLQTLAIFTTTAKDSVSRGKAQVEAFQKLLAHYPNCFSSCKLPLNGSTVQLIPAFENASSFADESEPFAAALGRLEGYIEAIGPCFYIGMTWDEENRFGGGNRAPSVGLKEDGRRLLHWMNGKKIAIDLSHTSDRLAYALFDYIDKEHLLIPVIASHSNFRAVSDYPRNLPDDLAKEIAKRGGLIGLNFFAPFIHQSDPSAIQRHVEYALALSAGDALCFGADFFCDSDFPNIQEKYQRKEAYYPELSDASVYPALLGRLADKIKEEQLVKIANQNALRFLQKHILF